MVLAPIVRGPQGRVRQAARGAARRGLRARQDRRRAAPARRGDRARQEVQARHRGRRRPARDEARPAQAAGRLDRDGGRAGRRAGRDRAGRRRGEIQTYSREVRLPRARAEPGRARAADLLASTRRTAPARAAPGSGSQMEIDPELVVPDPTLSIGEGAIAPWAASASDYYDQLTAGDRRALRRRPRGAVGGPAGRVAGPLPVRHQRRPRPGLLPQPLRPPALLRDALRGDRPEPRAPLPRDRLRAGRARRSRST